LWWFGLDVMFECVLEIQAWLICVVVKVHG
jgi:hypothetical protein